MQECSAHPEQNGCIVVFLLKLTNQILHIMRNKLLILSSFMVIGFAIVSWTAEPGIQKSASGDGTIPAGISKILDNSCNACHGENGKSMALAHLKLAQWGSYTPEKQADKAADIAKMVVSGKMPPKGYLNNNPAATLSKAQIDSIANWAAGVK
jgi:mono/diheme cytochrome c family protein